MKVKRKYSFQLGGAWLFVYFTNRVVYALFHFVSMNTYLAHHFLPPHISDHPGSEEYWRALLCAVALVLTGALTSPAVILFAFLLHNHLLAWVSASILLSAIAQMIVMRWVGNLRLTALLFVVWQHCVIVGSAFIMGSLSSVVLVGLFSPPLIALTLMGKRSMWIMLILAVVSIAGLIVIELYGIAMPQQYPTSLAPIINGFICIIVVSGILISFYYFGYVRNSAYQQLQVDHHSVQQRVQEATLSLEAQNTALQQALNDVETANKLKDEFLRNVTHEIRTPLTTILGFSEILSERLAEDDDNQPFIEHIKQAGTGLLGVFSNILTLSRIEANEITSDPHLVGTRYLLNHVADAIKPKVELKGLQFTMNTEPDFPEYVVLDGNHLQHILVYLCENAVKFTEHGEVCLKSRIEYGTRTYFVAEVCDTGIGIAPEYLDRLFTPFHQQDGSKTRAVGGLGLGLAITKRLLDILGGTITIESTLGKGSIFTVKIPCTVEKKSIQA